MDLKNAPYYDDYDPTKSYTQLLAVGGRVEQAREFTQLQSLMQDYLKRLGDSILRDGSIIEGCSLLISNNTAIIQEGKMYLSGLVRLIPETVVPITRMGQEIIGVKLAETIVTEVEDPSLRDNAVGELNYGQKGMHRVKSSVSFHVNDNTAITVFTLVDGGMQIVDLTPDISQVTNVLARRTYDESGNYKLWGMELSNRNEENGAQIFINIGEGKSYIKGYEVQKPVSARVGLDYSRETKDILYEPKTYLTGTTRYKLNSSPVNNILQVSCTMQKTQTITRGNVAGTIDILPNSPVITIVSVVQSGTTYTPGVDYQLTNDGVDWSLGGRELVTGTQYQVTWNHTQSLIIGTDVQLTVLYGSSYMDFKTVSSKPLTGTQMLISYDLFLYRRDLVCLDRYGAPVIIKGKPDIDRLVASPVSQNDDILRLGSVLVYPNSSKVDIMSYSVTRLSMDDLYRLSRRVDDAEYNQAQSDLDVEAQRGESATSLKGILTEGFMGFTKADVSHSQFHCAIDLDRSEMAIASPTSVNALIPNMASASTTAKLRGRILSAPYNETLAISQSYSTDSMLVNPYAVYDRMSLITLEPKIDNWIDETTMVVQKQVVEQFAMTRWWYHRGEAQAEADRIRWLAIFGDTSTADGWEQKQITKTEVVQTIILDQAIMYMRQSTIKVTGDNFAPYTDNIVCTFDNQRINLIPTSPTLTGTQTGTVRANSTGGFTATFVVPENMVCGSKEVKCTTLTGVAATPYIAQGRKRATLTTVLTTTLITQPTDPLAQSFSFEEEDTILTSVGLFFASKDPSKAVNVQIRSMVNGYPGNVCYSQKIVQSSSINVSATGLYETRVTFDEPVYCVAGESYCICILSDSNLYSMFVGTLLNKDLNTGSYVSQQPYSVGVLFSSSNASTWTAHQTQDLKFNAYKASYYADGVVIFNDLSPVLADKILLTSDEITKDDTAIEWYYQVNYGHWMSIESYSDRDLGAVATRIGIKCIIRRTGSISPLIAVDSLSLIRFNTELSGTYVSRNVLMDENFTNLRVSVELALGTGMSSHIYYSTDSNGTTWTELTNPVITPVDADFSKYSYIKTGISATNYRVKLVLNSTSQLLRPRARRLMNILKY